MWIWHQTTYCKLQNAGRQTPLHRASWGSSQRGDEGGRWWVAVASTRGNKISPSFLTLLFFGKGLGFFVGFCLVFLGFFVIHRTALSEMQCFQSLCWGVGSGMASATAVGSVALTGYSPITGLWHQVVTKQKYGVLLISTVSIGPVSYVCKLFPKEKWHKAFISECNWPDFKHMNISPKQGMR